MDVFVVLGWSESNRLEVPSADRPLYYRSGNPNVAWFDDSADLFHRVNYGWNGVTPYEKQMIPQYQKFMAENEFMLEYWALTNVLMIQSYLKSRGIRYIMCNTMHMASKNNPTVESLLDQIDDSRYYMNNSFFPKYRALGYVNEKAKYWHHGEEPHRLFAEELYDFLGYGNDLD
jgi:hypothetical protein